RVHQGEEVRAGAAVDDQLVPEPEPAAEAGEGQVARGVVEARHQQGRPARGGERRAVGAGGRVIDPQHQRPGADVDLVVVVVVRVAAVEVDRPQVGRGAVVEHRVDVGRAIDAGGVEGLDAGQGHGAG